MKLSLTLLECGTCGKPRGLRHVCVSTRKRRRARIRPGLRFTCKTCGKQTGNPLTHTCTVKTDFKQRKARAERRAKAQRERERKAEVAARRKERERQRRAEVAARRRERRRRQRAEAAARRKAAAKARREKARTAAKASRPRAPTHNPRTCKDEDCQRYGCLKYKEGFADGTSAGYSAGVAVGAGSPGGGD